MPIEFKKISAAQLLTLPRDKTVFFFPVGPLEDHGPHLPLGLDTAEASQLSYLTAQHLEAEMQDWVGVLMPEMSLGIDSDTTQLAITVRPHVLRDWLVDACHGLIRAGFFHFVCFSGSLAPKQLTAIEEAGKIIHRSYLFRFLNRTPGYNSKIKPTLVSASSALVSLKNFLESPFWPDPKEHGGARDTSIGLAVVENQVDSIFSSLLPQERESSRWKRNWMRHRRKLKSYWGTPSQGTVEQGEKILLETLDQLFPKLRAVWGGSNPNRIFRSWYSILPPNKSFFKAWALALWILVLLAGWAFLYGIF